MLSAGSLASMVAEPVEISSSDEDEQDDLGHKTVGFDLRVSNVLDVMEMDDDVMIIEKPTDGVVWKREKGRSIRSAIDEDECCILDTDPTAAAMITAVQSFDTEELVMTRESGPVACRDFPHARYLCVHFPFKTSHHSKYCAQCHCYVCDTLAPCSLWGEGNHSSDHCHAFDKELSWKTLRKIAKALPVPPVTSTLLPVMWARQTATLTSQVVSALSDGLDKSGSLDKDGANTGAQASLLQGVDAVAPPTNESSVCTSGAMHKMQSVISPAKLDPLVIKLQGKGRKGPSQASHLGVRTSRSQRILPQTSHPTFRPPSLFRPRSGARMEVREFQNNPLHTTQSTLTPNAAPVIPSHVPPPPLTLFCPPPSHPPDYNHLLRTPGEDSTAADFGLPVDSRYVPASPQSDQQACSMNMAPLYTDYNSMPYCLPDPSYVRASMNGAQDSIDQPFVARSNMLTPNIGAADILAGPPEGWGVDVAALYDEFQTGLQTGLQTGISTKARHGSDEQQARVTLDDVLEQFASEEHLWTDFPDI